MPRTAFVILLLPALALAAPVPKAPPRKIEDVFGTPTEANGVTLEMTRRDELRATVGKEAATAVNSQTKARPLATKTVEGDFELTVRISHAPPADKELAATGPGVPTLSAGIALFSRDNPKCSLTYFHKHTLTGGWKSQLSMNSQHERGGSGTGRQAQKLEDQPLYLRLTRKGDEFRSETSADGKTWQRFGTHKVQGFGPVVVGPAAVHNTTAGYEVTFDEYQIKPLSEEK
jgi:hypothetical protein